MADVESRAEIVITGRVQGVFYRSHAAEKARALGLSGWIRNEPDGSVRAVVEGESDRLRSFVAWCAAGPPDAVVADVAASYAAPTGEFADFTVRH